MPAHAANPAMDAAEGTSTPEEQLAAQRGQYSSLTARHRELCLQLNRVLADECARLVKECAEMEDLLRLVKEQRMQGVRPSIPLDHEYVPHPTPPYDPFIVR